MRFFGAARSSSRTSFATPSVNPRTRTRSITSSGARATLPSARMITCSSRSSIGEMPRPGHWISGSGTVLPRRGRVPARQAPVTNAPGNRPERGTEGPAYRQMARWERRAQEAGHGSNEVARGRRGGNEPERRRSASRGRLLLLWTQCGDARDPGPD
jgi:hypothetical protein